MDDSRSKCTLSARDFPVIREDVTLKETQVLSCKRVKSKKKPCVAMAPPATPCPPAPSQGTPEGLRVWV